MYKLVEFLNIANLNEKVNVNVRCLSVPDKELFSKRRPLVLFCFRLY